MKLSYFTITNKLRFLSMLFLFLASSISGFGQKNIYKAPTHGNIYDNEAIMNGPAKVLIDPELHVPNHISIVPKAYVKLKADSETGPFSWSKTIVNLKVTPILPGGSEDSPYELALEVEYNPNGNSTNFIDLSTHEITNRYGVKVEVLSFSTIDVESNSPTPWVNENITLELGFESERYYQVTQQLPIIQAGIVYDTTDPTPVALQFNWAPLAGALEYELEWTWVDNYPSLPGSSPLDPSQIKFSSRDFELNNTKIRTKDTNYEIPLIYSKGYIIYRVRAVGRFTDNLIDVYKTFFGPWSSGTAIKSVVSNWTNSFISVDAAHENLKNWQFKASYAEEGKKKEVVSYFDGSLRNRQTVTKVNTNNNAVVGETIYDAQGRAAIEVLPVPIKRNYIRYFKNLNKNLTNGNPYTHLDFDWDSVIEGVPSCDPPLAGMDPISGSSWYFSNQNNIDSPFRDFIPDAKNLPFSQTEYTPDNTGRINRKGGVGLNHQLGTGHEMKYFYSVPNQEELNRLFGYHVGLVSHYQKNIVVDPNGQVSVTYLDPQGRAIATALAGEAPTEGSGTNQVTTLLPLDDCSQTAVDAEGHLLHDTITTDLLNKVNVDDFDTVSDNNDLVSTFNFYNHKDDLVVSKSLGVAGDSQHKFKYHVKNNAFFTSEKCDRYSFVYDFNFSLKDQCGVDQFVPISNLQIGTRDIWNSTFEPDPIGFDLNPAIQPTDGVILKTGSYSLLKELKVSQTVLNYYAKHYVDKLTTVGSECYIDPSTFAPELSIDCNVTCDECNASIGTESDYILKQLNGVYHVLTSAEPPVVSPFVVSPTTFAVTIVSQPAPDSSINFGQPIVPADVDGMVVRFRADWARLHEACEQLCGPVFSSSCNTNRQALLTDVSPGGQYGGFEDIDLETPAVELDILSLFNENNKIIYKGMVNGAPDPGSPGNFFKNNWRNPLTPYLDENGQVYRIEVLVNEAGGYLPEVVAGLSLTPDADGRFFIQPQELRFVSDFITNWKPYWANSLIMYHPEYTYLEYADAVCELKKSTTIPVFNADGTPATPQQEDLSSDEYDSFLNYIDTYDKAEDAGLFNLASPISTVANQTPIFEKDPYFSNQIGYPTDQFETADLFGLRKDIMIKALGTQYENNTIDGTTTNLSTANQARLFEVAVQMAKCNAIQICNYNDVTSSSSWINDLTDEEKNRIWDTYKGLYISLKQKIKHVFSNTYATTKGAYNGCIGQVSAPGITNVINNYTTEATAINTYINDGNNPTPVSGVVPPVFCAVPEAINYRVKDKRFIPIDALYDSGVNAQDALNQLNSLGQYQYYLQTGNCPLINDLSLYLDGLFKDVNLNTPPVALNAWTRIGQGLSAKLFGEFTGQTVLPLATTPVPAVDMTVNGLDLEFEFTPATPALPRSLVLTLPSTSNLSWNNYSMQSGANNWHIISFSQLFYDHDASTANGTLTATPPAFLFSVVARIVNNAGQISDVVLTGETIARIGECHVAGDGDGPGEVMNPETADCNKKELFGDALKNLMIHLQTIGQFDNSNYVLVGPGYVNSVFYNGFLRTYFGVDSNDLVEWRNPSGGTQIYNGSIYVNQQRLIYFEISDLDINHDTITDVSIGSLINGNTYNFLGITVNNQDGLHQLTDAKISAGIGRVPLYFACCSPCGEWDYNGNGIGDLCDGVHTNLPTCSVNASEELTYENNLKDFLNDFLVPGHHFVNINGDYTTDIAPIANNTYAANFVQESNLVTLYQSLRNQLELEFNSSNNIPVAPMLSYYITTSGTNTQITFYSNDQNNASLIHVGVNMRNVSHINYIDVIGSQTMVINYVDNQGNTQTVSNAFISNQTIYAYPPPSQMFYGKSFCSFLSQDYSEYVSRKNKFNSTVLKDGKIEFLNNGLAKGTDPIDPEDPKDPKSPACNCVPQTVKPVDFDDKYATFTAFINSTGLAGLSNSYDAEHFYAAHLQYVVDSYIQYITLLNITSVDNPNFLTIAAFGDTGLHYGYDHIADVIAQYVDYNNDPYPIPIYSWDDVNDVSINIATSADPRYYWKEFVNSIYMPTMVGLGLCPPLAMAPESIPVILTDPCTVLQNNISATYQMDSYNAYIEYLRQEFIKNYIKEAMGSVVENFEMNYADKEYQYTLYYYDQAGNLIQTVAPKGVNRFNSTHMATYNTAIKENQTHPLTQTEPAENASLVPGHTFKTEYKYNSLNQLIWQLTPDGGRTVFAYDKLGRIIASQNAKQANTIIEEGNVRFSYTKYDYLGRIIEAGEVHTPIDANYAISNEGRLLLNNVVVNEFDNSLYKTEVTRTIYDEDPLVENSPSVVYASSLFITNTTAGYNPAHSNRNRVTGVYSYNNYDPSYPESFDNAIFYNYDVHGNVKELLNYYSALKQLACTEGTVIDLSTGTLNDCEKHIKRVVYDYNLISGNVNRVTIQPNKKDQFIQKYNYDADNKIVNVETSPDGVIWEKDANYKYYPHGSLARVELGDKRVQGIDYAYTLQGWLKGVNGENITDPSNDMGNDGEMTFGTTKTKDAFGYSLSYYDNDYKAISANDDESASYKPFMFSRDSSIPGNDKNLYNGNIKQMTTAIRKNQDELLKVQKNNYTYDQLSRIKAMSSNAITPDLTGYNNFNESYSSSYSYDKNGNIKSLTRKDPNTQMLDNLDYKYLETSNPLEANNRLLLVEDSAGATAHPDDLESQIAQLTALDNSYVFDMNNRDSHNYKYDEIGQLTEDVSEGLKIEWRVDGKVKSVTKRDFTKITFEYDGLGNRVSKSITNTLSSNQTTTSTYYVRDAQGNPLAVYKLDTNSSRAGFNASLKLKEHHLFGSSRLGLEEKDLLIYKYITNRIVFLKDSEKKETLSNIAQNTIETEVDSTVVNRSPVTPTLLNATPLYVSDYKTYSLNVASSTVATWNEPYLTSINPNFNTISLDSKFKVDQATTPPASILIGQVETMGSGPYLDNNQVIINPTLVKRQNVTVNTTTNTITKTSGTSGSWDAGGSSDFILKGDGYVERKITGTIASNNYIMLGLSYADANFGFTAINYALYNYGVGTILHAYENNTQITLPTATRVYADGDVLKVERVNHEIRYYKNNSLLRTVPEAAQNYGKPMIVDFALRDLNATIYNLRVVNYKTPKTIENNHVTNNPALVNTQNISIDATSGNITKTSTPSWNAGGATTAILTGDGYVERTLSGTLASNYNIMLGLSYRDDNITYLTIDYGLYTYSDNKLRFYENNVSSSPSLVSPGSTAFAVGDVLRVERKNGKIKYFKNELLLRDVAESNPGDAMLVDFSMADVNTTIYNLKVVNYDPQPVQAEVKTTAKLYAEYSGGVFKPKVILKKEVFANDTNNQKEFVISNIANTSITPQQMATIGMDVKLNANINYFWGSDNNVTGSLIINGGAPQSFTATVVNTLSLDAPTTAVSKLGSGVGKFDICSINYSFTGGANTLTRGFDFNNNVGVTLNNPPVSTTGSIAMSVTPTVVRVLGPCLFDTDQDGVFDIFEDANNDNDYANDDIDGDGIANYLDTDDDGDGLLTKWEGSDLDGDHIPTQGATPPLNSNALVGPSLDTVADYLDSDDDGDGVDTKFESPDPDGDHNAATGTLPLNSDGDGISNYLDMDDDGDGVFTFHEGTNPDGDLNPSSGATQNTDHYITQVNTNVIVDAIPDYLDTDDDGDGILTKFEGSDLDGDHDPTIGATPPLNTNAVAGSYTNMAVNTIPNYLDPDDDGDGYATLEDAEKGTAAPTGNPYTLDDDGDGVPNYLDYADIIFPDVEESASNDFANLVGDKRYELSNHLGNVLSVINDKKIPTIFGKSNMLAWFNADIISYSDYYPFGMLIPMEDRPAGVYRYGFSDKEMDNEIKGGEGNSIDFGSRMYDPRVGRWFAPDPMEKKYPSFSTYNFCLDNPIMYHDPNGEDPITGLLDAVVSFALDVGLDYISARFNGDSHDEAVDGIGWISAGWGAAKTYALSCVTPTGTGMINKIAKVANSKVGKFTISIVEKMSKNIKSNYEKGDYHGGDGKFHFSNVDLTKEFWQATVETLIENGLSGKADSILADLKESNKSLYRKLDKLLKKAKRGESTQALVNYGKTKVKDSAVKSKKKAVEFVKEKAKEKTKTTAVTEGEKKLTGYSK
jgi:RHS repeat-associated protein